MVLLLQLVLSTIALVIVSEFVPGFFVLDFQSAVIAGLAIGILNAAIGALFRIISLPGSTFTMGVVLLVVNSMAIKLAPAVVPGFRITGFEPALWGAIALAALGMLIKAIVEDA